VNFIQPYKPQRALLWKTTLLFILVAGLLIVTDQISIHYGLSGSQRLADDLLGGLIAGLIFYFFERHRLKHLRERLRVIDLMNHHIRNALQPLMFMDYEQRTSMRIVEGCVRRIDWALREVLPGKSNEPFVIRPGYSLEEAAKDRAWSSSSDANRSLAESANSPPGPFFGRSALYLEKPK